MTAPPSFDAAHFNQAARMVLRQFLDSRQIDEIQFLANHGGFSGACLWRVQSGNEWFCLRAWPFLPSLESDLPRVHWLMVHARNAALHFVPAVYRTSDGATFARHADRCWELTSWMPGRADFHERPMPHRLAAACAALARLHQVWRPVKDVVGPCPAIQRRQRRCQEWAELVASGWQPPLAPNPLDVCAEPARRAWQLLGAWHRKLPDLLGPWMEKTLPLQLCHCDVWHDHVLFEGDEVSGLVDYGSVKTDNVAVDLARMLGSMAGDNPKLWTAGLEGYRSVRPLSVEEESLAHVLDRTGTVLAAANWLIWLYKDGRSFPDRQAVAQRLACIVARVESWM